MTFTFFEVVNFESEHNLQAEDYDVHNFHVIPNKL
jgi:hypothetical protein